MKKIIAIAAIALAGSAYGQLNPLPPSSTTNGVFVQPIGVNAGVTHWNATPGLGTYNFASDGTLLAPSTNGWSTSSASIVTALNSLSLGGTVRSIFLGESAGWLNDFGYSYSGDPTSGSSYTVFSNIQAFGAPNIAFGDHVDITLAAGQASTFDLWFNGVGGFGANPGFVENGGVYEIFNPTSNVRYSSTVANTWIPSLATYVDVTTYLVGIEDFKLSSSDNDFNDFVFALQFFNTDGTPFTPVPEPSTYGLIGAAALLGLIMVRRFKTKK